MNRYHQISAAIHAKRYPSIFLLAVLIIKNRNGPNIIEHSGSTFEADPVLSQIPLRFSHVPLTDVAQAISSAMPCAQVVVRIHHEMVKF